MRSFLARLPLLALLAWARCSAGTIPVTVSDNLNQSVKGPVGGNGTVVTVKISWPTFTTVGGVLVTGGSVTTNVPQSGMFSYALQPNQGVSPQVYYTFLYTISDGLSIYQYYEQLVVPISSVPVSLYRCRVFGTLVNTITGQAILILQYGSTNQYGPPANAIAILGIPIDNTATLLDGQGWAFSATTGMMEPANASSVLVTGSASITPGIVNDGVCSVQGSTITMTGIVPGTAVSTSVTPNVPAGVIVWANTTAANTAALTICNSSGQQVNLGAATYSLSAIH